MSESEDNMKITFEVLLAECNKTMIFWPVTPWSIEIFLLQRRQQIPHKHRALLSNYTALLPTKSYTS